MVQFNRQLVNVFCIVLVLSFLVSCSRQEVEVSNTVTAYTRLLSEALAKPDASVVGLFASRAEIVRIDSYITYNLKDHRVIINELLAFDFKDIEISGQSASVNTYESWRFHYVDDKTRQRVTDDEIIDYLSTYHLIQSEGRWVVDRVEVVNLPTGGEGAK